MRVRFYGDLNDFLAPRRRQVEFEVTVAGSPAVKDVIESAGVPHVEVDLILAGDVSVGFAHRVTNADRIAVFPMFESIAAGGLSPLRELCEPKFFADVGLRKLARDLRLFGFDTRWSSTATDPEIIDTSLAEERIILTRDIGILKTARVTHGLFVRSTDPATQIDEIVDRLRLRGSMRPFTICLACNGTIEDERRCASCGRSYWKGTHYDALLERVRRLHG